MKLSTRIKKYVDPALLWSGVPGDICDREIVLMVDHGRRYVTHSFKAADSMHKLWTEKWRYKLLPLNECPVVNGNNEIIMHYTSTTYRDWCNK